MPATKTGTTMKKSKPFRFKEFTIFQELAAFKVTGDSVFLGAWADFSGNKQILDLGTGTGLLALMAAQRNPEAQITALEIDPDSAAEARHNAAHSPWKDRIHIKEGDFSDFTADVLFDHIICNPPYFSNQLQNPDERLRSARHAAPEFFRILFRKGYEISTAEARLSLVLPEQTFEQLPVQLWQLVRKTILKTGTDSRKKLVCAEFRKNAADGPRISELYIRNRDGYTKEYLEQTRDFYLFAP